MRLASVLLPVLFAGTCAQGQDLVLEIPAVHTSFAAGGQTIPVTAWGRVSGASAASLRLALTADLAGLQQNITPVLQAELNRQDHCGERLAVDQGTLAPAEPAALLTAHLRYERWGCAKVFGKETARRLVGGNAVVTVKLTPTAGADGIGVQAETTAIDADGSLGDVLRSGSAGAAVKEKIAASIQSAIRKSMDLKSALPERIAAASDFQSARFSSGPGGKLWISTSAGLRLSPEEWEGLARLIKPAR